MEAPESKIPGEIGVTQGTGKTGVAVGKRNRESSFFTFRYLWFRDASPPFPLYKKQRQKGIECRRYANKGIQK